MWLFTMVFMLPESEISGSKSHTLLCVTVLILQSRAKLASNAYSYKSSQRELKLIQFEAVFTSTWESRVRSSTTTALV